MYKITSHMTEADFIEYNIHHMNNSKSLKRTQFFMRFLFPVMFLMFGVLANSLGDIFYWIIFAIGSVGMFLWLPKMFEKSVTKRIEKMLKEKDNGDMFGEKVYSFSEDGIYVTSENTANTYTWPSIVKIEESETTFYLFISSIQAIIVPKRAVERETTIEEFRQFIGSKVLKHIV